MNSQTNLVLGNIIMLGGIALGFILVYINHWRNTYLLCKMDVLEALEFGFPLPVEIVDGTYKVVSKVCKDQISMIRIYDGRQVGSILHVCVPSRMQSRIIEHHIYVFHFDSMNHEICFNDGAMHREQSNFTKEEIVERFFSRKKQVLCRLNR